METLSSLTASPAACLSNRGGSDSDELEADGVCDMDLFKAQSMPNYRWISIPNCSVNGNLFSICTRSFTKTQRKSLS